MLGKALAAAAYDLEPGVRDRVLARIGGPIGVDARAAIAELAGVGSTTVTRARWAADARVPVPQGIRSVHPTWIEDLLFDLPPAARAVVAGGGQGNDVAVWLARWATATIPPMAGGAPALELALSRSEAELGRWLHDLGADQLAYSASAAGAVMLAAMTRRYPAVQRALARIALPPRAGQLGPIRAAIARCRGNFDDLFLIRVGARCLAPHLAGDPVMRRRLVLRFPRPTGMAVDEELRSHAATPLDQVPAWAALGDTVTP